METGETIKKGLLRLERYAQNIPGGFHCCAEDPENGYPFAYISDRFLEILGWEREEFAAKFNNRYTALLHPDDLADGLRYRNAPGLPGKAAPRTAGEYLGQVIRGLPHWEE